MLHKLYSKACTLNWNYPQISFSSHVILCSSLGWAQKCGTWPYCSFFMFLIIFCYLLSFRFLFTRKCFMWQILSSIQETQQQGMYTCKNLKFSSCSIWKVPYQKTYGFTKNFLWAGVYSHIVCLTCVTPARLRFDSRRFSSFKGSSFGA
jgi:hypothetical protein